MNNELGGFRQYTVPAKFWDDYCDRCCARAWCCPCDGDPDIEMAREVSRSGNLVLIEGFEDQIECLRSDAKSYADKFGPDQCPPGLKASARETLKALAA